MSMSMESDVNSTNRVPFSRVVDWRIVVRRPASQLPPSNLVDLAISVWNPDVYTDAELAHTPFFTIYSQTPSLPIHHHHSHS